jgi:hypothetical protein
VIDWEKPLRFVGSEQHAKYLGPAPGGDVWVAGPNPGHREKYTKTGVHINYVLDTRLPNIENWPINELHAFAARRIREARQARRMSAALEHVPGYGTW